MPLASAGAAPFLHEEQSSSSCSARATTPSISTEALRPAAHDVAQLEASRQTASHTACQKQQKGAKAARGTRHALDDRQRSTTMAQQTPDVQQRQGPARAGRPGLGAHAEMQCRVL